MPATADVIRNRCILGVLTGPGQDYPNILDRLPCDPSRLFWEGPGRLRLEYYFLMRFEASPVVGRPTVCTSRQLAGYAAVLDYTDPLANTFTTLSYTRKATVPECSRLNAFLKGDFKGGQFERAEVHRLKYAVWRQDLDYCFQYYTVIPHPLLPQDLLYL